MRALLLLLASLALAACAGRGHPPGLRPAHVERLYFGRAIGDTGVELVHLVTRDVEERVQRVIDEYKRRFAQQAVLRLVTDVRANL